MKTILVGTDFSESAKNAINYAVELTKLAKTKLILFHAFHIPAVPTDVPLVMPLGDLEHDNLKELNKIKKQILHQHGNKLQIECITKLGFAVDEINELVTENKIDLIVMGLHGAGYLSEKLIGSVTTTLIKKAKCPILIINEDVKFKQIKNIVLACDYQKLDSNTILGLLKELINIFGSRLYILNVIRDKEPISPTTKIESGAELNQFFEGIDHTFNFTENEDIVQGVNDFVKKNNIDLVVMIPRKHKLFETLFKERNTKRMAFHSHIPILTLHE